MTDELCDSIANLCMCSLPINSFKLNFLCHDYSSLVSQSDLPVNSLGQKGNALLNLSF